MYDEVETSTLNKQNIITTLTTKLLYQWFGNLLTLDYWPETWLLHAFTNFFSYKIYETDEVQMRLRDQFNVHVLQKSLEMDSSDQSHALHHYDSAITPSHLRETFHDQIYALKGASMLNWIEDLIGKQKFQECMVEYVKEG